MMKSFKTEVKMPTYPLEKLKKTIGVCRYVYNLYLQKAKEHDEQTGKFLSG